VAIKAQQEGRRLEQFADKFGRVYEANVEITTGDPCEALRPVGWSAPAGPHWFRGMLNPPIDDHEVVKMVPRLLRARKGYQIEIDHARWLQKYDEADEAFAKKIADYAQGMTKGRADMIAWIQNPPPELRKLVGNGPRNIPRAFIQAAAAGNPWALGLSEKVPAKAEALLEELQPLITGKRHKVSIDYDPLADDDEPQDFAIDAGVEAILDPLDELAADLEEQFDPKATGGTMVQSRKKRRDGE
jgi:hypothetical protein